MTRDSEQRAQLLKGILAGGMVFVGLQTGSNPFFTLLLTTSVNVGANILSSVAEKAFDNWRDGWFTPNGMLNDDIRTALRQSFKQALRQLEIDWQNQPDYNYLKYNNERERAQFSVQLIQELRESSQKLFESGDALALPKDNATYLQVFGLNSLADADLRNFLENTIEQFFSPVESLARFAKAHLPGNWVLRFDNIIRGEKGTRAWRACQQLWQASLSTSLMEMQKSFKQTQGDIVQINQDVKKIIDWLNDWEVGLANQSDMQRNPIGEKALADSLQTFHATLDRRLSSLQEGTQLIIDLFRERFAELEFNRVMTNFLQKELLADENVNLEQAGHQTDEDISLSQVFVDLPVSNGVVVDPPGEELADDKLPPGIIAEIVKTAETPLDPKSLSLDVETEKMQPAGQLSLFKEDPVRKGRFVLIGGPGQGKSTISQLACQLFRVAILKQIPPNQLDYKVKKVIQALEELCKEEGITSPVVSRFPIRVVLSDFAEKLAKKEGVSSLITYITDRIRTKTDQEVTPSVLRKWLGAYPWIIILDGLDEVPASSNRDAVLTAIEEFRIDARSENADVLIIATTRPQGYNKDFAPDLYQHKYLMPLSTVRAERYGAHLVNVRYKQDNERRHKVFERLQRALNEETTSRLMQSPLQVTIMTALLGKIGTPPQERWSLFSQYYEVIYQRETERNIPASAVLRDYQPDINAIHYQVGMLIQIESEYPERTGARLSKDRFSRLVELRLRSEGHEGTELQKLRDQIIEAAANRLVFLVGVEADQIGFEIRSLQEFMAAEAVMDGSDEQVRSRLQKIAPIAHWRNVFLFAAGKCFAKQQHLRDTVHVICETLNEVDEPDSQVIALTKVGSQLAMDLLADGTAQRQPKYARLLAKEALRLLKSPPNQYQLRLADVYEPKLEEKYKEELISGIQTVSPGQYGAWALLSTLAEKGLPWAEKLSEKHWPQQLDERLDLLNSGIGENYLWFGRKLNYDLLHLPAPDLYELIQYRRLKQRANLGDSKELEWLAFLSWRQGPNFEVEARLNPANDGETIFNFYVTEVESDRVSSFPAFKDSHKDWLPFQMAAKFSANPSKEVLADAFRSLNDFEIPEYGRHIYQPLPWPLAALLDYAQGSQNYAQIADDVQQGN